MVEGTDASLVAALAQSLASHLEQAIGAR